MYFKRKKVLNGKNTIKSFQRETVFEGKNEKCSMGTNYSQGNMLKSIQLENLWNGNK